MGDASLPLWIGDRTLWRLLDTGLLGGLRPGGCAQTGGCGAATSTAHWGMMSPPCPGMSVPILGPWRPPSEVLGAPQPLLMPPNVKTTWSRQPHVQHPGVTMRANPGSSRMRG